MTTMNEPELALHPRDRQTGRYIHQMGWQGYAPDGGEYSRCDLCGKWWLDGAPINWRKVP